MTLNDPDNRLEHLKRLSRILDSAVTLPGGFRIGLDGILGLIPGIGDAIGATLSSYIILQAARMGAGPGKLFIMIVNVLLETVVGAIPVLGDLFDFAWKANQRNVALLESRPANPVPQSSARRRLGLATGLLLAVFILLLVVFLVWIIKLIFALAAGT